MASIHFYRYFEMHTLSLLLSYGDLMPAILMLCAALWSGFMQKPQTVPHWKSWHALSLTALVFSVVTLLVQLVLFFGLINNSVVSSEFASEFSYVFSSAISSVFSSELKHDLLGAPIVQDVSWSTLSLFNVTLLSAMIAVLVQLLGVIIGYFSSRYLQGEHGQQRYMSALAGVLASVHVLLLANHWVVLIAAWAMVGLILQKLLCFYQERPFALLAAHKKRIADRLADGLLIIAAALAWHEVGNGSLSNLWIYLANNPISVSMQWSGVCLVLAIILRTALLPVHGWLIQVMEAPTPVSALLHAGVINLGGFVLIRFAPLLEVATAARWLLVFFGLMTAFLAGLVMLTRISIKVRLAWSTVAQMGFMLVECGLGLYTIAAMHLIGHSLYKASAFLMSSSVVRQTKLKIMRESRQYSAFSLCMAPIISFLIIMLLLMLFESVIQHVVGDKNKNIAWPMWWSGILAFAWAPLLWFSPLAGRANGVRIVVWQLLTGVGVLAGLTVALQIGHILPFALTDAPDHLAGYGVLCAMVIMYFCIAILQIRAHTFIHLRRWGYAGFYIDEWYTRCALRFWPTQWANQKKNHRS